VAADRYAAMLTHHAERQGATVWLTYGRCLKGMALMKRDGFDVGVPMLSAAVAELRTARFVHYTAFLAALAEGLAGVGEAARGLAVLDEALAQSDKAEERWILAELLRLKGELVLLQQDVPNAAAIAAGHFQQSLEWARRQGALAWELRSATSLARLLHRQRKTSQARTGLASVYRRFTEGFDTADVVTAKMLLESFR
jgi:hypothetical protein